MMPDQPLKNRWALPVLLLVLVIGVIFAGWWRGGFQFGDNSAGGSDSKTVSKEYLPGNAHSGKKVQLVVDFGDGYRWQHSAIAWKQGMTILEALNIAKKHPRGLEFIIKGTGEKAMLIELDHVENQGSSGADNNKNWIFYVNNHSITKSIAVIQLKPTDVILCKYEVYKYNP